MESYIALLRGINVGGNALIKMSDLAKVFESLKFKNVRTLLASGNVLFESSEKDGKALEAKIEKALKKAFGLDIAVILRNHAEVAALVKADPLKKKRADENWKPYVVFLKEEPAKALKKPFEALGNEYEVFELRGREVFAAVRKDAPRPGFSGNFIEKHLKVRATARNWNTVAKLAKLGQAAG